MAKLLGLVPKKPDRRPSPAIKRNKREWSKPHSLNTANSEGCQLNVLAFCDI